MKTNILIASIIFFSVLLHADTTWSTGAYNNDANISKTLSINNANSLTVLISGETEQNYDFINIYNENGAKIAQFSGDINSTIDVYGSSIKAELISDYSVTKSGVSVSISTSSCETTWSTGAYKNNTNMSKILCIDNANSLKVLISGKTEQNYDFIKIYNENGIKIEQFSGDINSSIDVNGSSIKAELISDSSVTENGVTISIDENILGSSTLKKTGQTKSYENNGTIAGNDNPKDGFIKDDGWYQKGVNPHYERNNSIEIITDLQTGLIWQDDINTKNNPKDWNMADNYCENLSIEGYDDWRLPSIEELNTITNFGKTNPAIDSDFNNVYSAYDSKYYWSSTIGSIINTRWALHPWNGVSLSYAPMSEQYYVRCVRGNPISYGTFTRNNDKGVVTNHTIGLEWQDKYNNDEIKTATWIDAIEYCETLELDGTGWRLPNYNELYVIADRATTTSPAINKSFKIFNSNSFWTSTTIDYHLYRNKAWGINFQDGSSHPNLNKDGSNAVRCVRDII